MESNKILSNGDLDYIIDMIDDEILFLNKIKKNLKKYAYMESKKGTIILLKFDSLIEEISRIHLEISVLEQTKIEYIKIKENYDD